MKTTPLNQIHKDAGASMVDFAGWEMPVYYTSLRDEHLNTRKCAGLFDLCHMGRIKVFGSRRREYLDYICTNRISDMQPGQARYSLLCNDKGTIIDDVIVYAREDFDLVVVNGANLEKDNAHFQKHAGAFDVAVEDWSRQWAMIAVQGPKSVSLMSSLTDMDLAGMDYYWSATCRILGVDTIAARTGYTGEDGYEFYMDAEAAPGFWRQLLEQGKALGLAPVGLGARDTLRLEAGMPLYGHEIDDTTNPLEAGLKFAVKLKKDDFIGKAALEKIKAAGLTRKLVGIEMAGKRIPRQHCGIFLGDDKIGEVRSGTFSPTLEKAIATAYVPVAHGKIGTELEIEIRNKRSAVRVCGKTFYKRETN
ncbi:glycine cleavage system aminomethyltransferase GcvT [Planctomycetota bacterium]